MSKIKENKNICNMPEKATIELHRSKKTGLFYLNFIIWTDDNTPWKTDKIDDGLWEESRPLKDKELKLLMDLLERSIDKCE